MDHRTKALLLQRLNRDAACIARHFGLRFRVIEAERAGVRRRYGACYDDGTIKIRLVHARTGAPLRYSSLVSTLCHELAHLRYWNHNARFEAYCRRLLAFARREGIYRPQGKTKSATGPAHQRRVAGKGARRGATGSAPGSARGTPVVQGRAGVQRHGRAGAVLQGARGDTAEAAPTATGKTRQVRRPLQLNLFG